MKTAAKRMKAKPNGREPRRLRTYAYTPICGVHRAKMTVYRRTELVVYFRCDKCRAAGTRTTGKAPVVYFEPAKPQQ